MQSACGIFTTVFVMMDPDHWDKSVDWYTQAGALENVKVVVVPSPEK